MTETATRPQPHSSSAPATQFTAFLLFKRSESWFDVPGSAWSDADAEVLSLFDGSKDSVSLRGAYSVIGLNPNVDVLFWIVAPRLELLQNLAIKLDKTTIGRHLRLREAYYGMAAASTYDPTHSPAFLRGVEPKRYLSVYPFNKTPEWFQLPYPERRQLMVEHGEMGREYPSVSTNTVSSFGIADQDWIVALEDDEPETLIKMVQKLREAKVREWTAIDTPIYLGERKALADVLTDLHG
jgi:chlorite dismutase